MLYGIGMHFSLIERHRRRDAAASVRRALNARPRPTDDHALPAALDGARGLLGLAGKAERGGGPLPFPSPLPLPRIPLHHDLMRSNLNGGAKVAKRQMEGERGKTHPSPMSRVFLAGEPLL